MKHEEKREMRKYQRLSLVIISIVSLTLFLIYRQQYNRLRHVLEVFNFFGTPCNVTQLQISDGVIMEHDWGPQPIWQQMDNKAYVYSAFLVDKNTVTGLGIFHNSVSLPKSCFVFYVDNLKPVKGKFSNVKLSENVDSGYAAHLYNCTFNNVLDQSPTYVAFKFQNEARFVKTLLTNTLEQDLKFNTTICIGPQTFSKKLALEFISYHNLLGVESFVFYHEQNFSHKVMKLLKNFSNILNMWFNFFPYNLPMSVPHNIANTIIEYDCKLRTRSQSKFSITLSLNEYIVPSFDKLKSPSANNLQLPVKKFCLGHNNLNRVMVLQNFEAIDDYKFNDIVKVNKNWFKQTSNAATVFDNSCYLHRYEKCDRSIKTKSDLTMKRYSTDLTRSTLVQLLIRENI